MFFSYIYIYKTLCRHVIHVYLHLIYILYMSIDENDKSFVQMQMLYRVILMCLGLFPFLEAGAIQRRFWTGSVWVGDIMTPVLGKVTQLEPEKDNLEAPKDQTQKEMVRNAAKASRWGFLLVCLVKQVVYFQTWIFFYGIFIWSWKRGSFKWQPSGRFFLQSAILSKERESTAWKNDICEFLDSMLGRCW